MDEETMTPFIAWGAGIKHKHQDIRSVALFLQTTWFFFGGGGDSCLILERHLVLNFSDKSDILFFIFIF